MFFEPGHRSGDGSHRTWALHELQAVAGYAHPQMNASSCVIRWDYPHDRPGEREERLARHGFSEIVQTCHHGYRWDDAHLADACLTCLAGACRDHTLFAIRADQKIDDLLAAMIH